MKQMPQQLLKLQKLFIMLKQPKNAQIIFCQSSDPPSFMLFSTKQKYSEISVTTVAIAFVVVYYVKRTKKGSVY